MEFFGDRERRADPRALAEELAADLARAAELPAGPRRHAVLAGCLVRTGELAQGLADAAEAGAGEDRAARAAMRAAACLARGLWRSWRAGGRGPPPRPSAVSAVLSRSLGEAVTIRRPEGYALYTLYPEPYAVAARDLAAARDLTVVGIRSIGTSLAAMVAAGAGSRRVPLTVRPAGHPFARRLEPTAAFAREIARRAGGRFAIVDEGPGLSGSSFAAVAEALLAAGVTPERIHLFTSHPDPPGIQASARVRALLARLPRHFVAFDDVFLGAGPLSVTRLAEDAIGPARLVDDLTGGKWRTWLYRHEGEWPPSEGWLERRKLLLDAGGTRYVARFAGIGRDGEDKLSRAHALAEAEVAIEPAALRHGFLFERWITGARPLTAAPAPRAAILAALRRLVQVSAARPRPPSDGAPPAELVEVARVNAAEALGPEAGEVARRLEDFLPDAAMQARPVEVDGKLQAWEWLVLPDGRLFKADGLDHHAAHDLAACQDALWDVAGAQVELGLTDREAVQLAEAARAVAPGAGPALLPFYRACFLALEVGRWTYASAGEPPGPERARRRAALARYRRAFAGALAALGRARATRRPRSTSAAPHPG
jgi:hypothetical protein